MAKSRLHMTHRQNNERYIEQGRQLCITMDPDADSELERMNKGKAGSPYTYPESTIMMLAIVRSVCGLSLRACQGMAEVSIGKKNTSHYGTIRKRMKKMRVSTDRGMATARSSRDVLRVAVDGTGLMPRVRGEWIRHVHKTRRGFIRVMVVDIDTREILAFRVIDEQPGEIKVFEQLVEEGLANAGSARECKQCGRGRDRWRRRRRTDRRGGPSRFHGRGRGRRRRTGRRSGAKSGSVDRRRARLAQVI